MTLGSKPYIINRDTFNGNADLTIHCPSNDIRCIRVKNESRIGTMKANRRYMIGRLARLIKDDRGAIVILFALMLPIIVGFVGIGVEVTSWYKVRRNMQTAADAAAITAAVERGLGSSATIISSEATREAARNGYDSTSDTITISNPPLTGDHIGDDAYVEVTINHPIETLFSGMFLTSAVSTTTRAVATTSGDSEACVLALSSTASQAIDVGSATVSMSGCGVVANSDASNAVNVQPGTLEVDCISTVGSVDGNGTITTTECTSPVEGATAVTDPFADIDVPVYDNTGCLTGNGNNAYAPADGETISEGVYCDGLSFNAGVTVTMEAGIYVIDEGDFSVNGGATVTGSDVTIILTAEDGSSYGSITINGGAVVELTAPTAEDTTGDITGDYSSILFYQDRNASQSPSLDAMLTGGSTTELTGAIYLPNNNITFNGGNETDDNGCLMIVAQEVSFNGDADLENECSMYGGNPITYGAVPGLVE